MSGVAWTLGEPAPSPTDASWLRGPERASRAERRARLGALVSALSDERDDLAGLALYGSMARAEDGAYSDVELLAVVDRGPDHVVREFRFGTSKAKLHVYREAALRQAARSVTPEWSLDYGKWSQLRAILEHRPLFGALPGLARAADPAALRRAARTLLLGELFEHVGKVRNLLDGAARQGVAPIAVRFAEHAALLLGILARAPFSSRGTLLTQASALPVAPLAYAALAHLVLEGQLGDVARVAAAIEQAWSAVATLAAEHGLGTDLDAGAPCPRAREEG